MFVERIMPKFCLIYAVWGSFEGVKDSLRILLMGKWCMSNKKPNAQGRLITPFI
jgi:hypothetical protein